MRFTKLDRHGRPKRARSPDDEEDAKLRADLAVPVEDEMWPVLKRVKALYDDWDLSKGKLSAKTLKALCMYEDMNSIIDAYGLYKSWRSISEGPETLQAIVEYFEELEGEVPDSIQSIKNECDQEGEWWDTINDPCIDEILERGGFDWDTVATIDDDTMKTLQHEVLRVCAKHIPMD
jgi:hypothetical protein